MKDPNEEMFLNMILDTSLSSSYMILDSIGEVDDDSTISILFNHMKKVYEQEADVYEWKKSIYFVKFKELLTNYVTDYLTITFLDNLKVGNRYSTGFMVIMNIEEVIRDETTDEVIKFLTSDNQEDDQHWLCIDDVRKNFEHQVKASMYKYFPILLPEL